MFYGKVIESSKGSLSLDKAQHFIASEKCGASLFFIGTVRNHNNNKNVTGITYDSHDAMVEKSFKEIFRTSPCSETGNEFVRVYLLRSEKEIVFNREEILQTKEYSIKEIEHLIKNQPEVFSGSFKHLFPFIKKGISLDESGLP